MKTTYKIHNRAENISVDRPFSTFSEAFKFQQSYDGKAHIECFYEDGTVETVWSPLFEYVQTVDTDTVISGYGNISPSIN